MNAVSFANAASIINNAVAKAQTQAHPVFNTKRTAADKVSAKTTMLAVHFDDKAKAIKVFCADGHTRQCNIDRLPSLEYGRQLWKTINEYGQKGLEVQFTAAGGFSPDRWFFDVQPVADENITM